MRDFPIFTTDFGVSSLVLREIPYRNEAYIHIQDVQDGFFQEHLVECISFCRMAGAKKVYACGAKELEQYPSYICVYAMQGFVERKEELVASLFPVTEKTAAQWRSLYNERMNAVDNARTLESRDEKLLIESTGTYFVHDHGNLLGIGWMEEDKVLALASVQPGAGERVMHTLLSKNENGYISLEVASTNQRAIRLYERIGLVMTGEVKRWHVVYSQK